MKKDKEEGKTKKGKQTRKRERSGFVTFAGIR
jgi:hypothetical protein